MHILGMLANFYKSAVINRFVIVLVFWLIWPGLMFVVGALFESRLVPIGRKQSKMFMPGDLSLGVMLTAIIGMYADTGVPIPLVDSPYWWLVITFVMVIVAWRLRKSDASSYPSRASRSPTKIVHDFFGYFLFPLVLIGLGIPQFGVLEDPGVFIATRVNWLVVSMAVVFYLFCTALDVTTYYDVSDINARHPEDWQPIWKKRK